MLSQKFLYIKSQKRQEYQAEQDLVRNKQQAEQDFMKDDLNQRRRSYHWSMRIAGKVNAI